MLSFEENSWSLKALKILSWLNLLPIEINVETGEIKIQSKWWKRYIWKFSYGLALVHWIYIFGRFMQMIVLPELFNWAHFVVHFLFVVGLLSMYVEGFILFFVNSLDLTLIANSVIMETGPPSELGQDDVENESQQKRENDPAQVGNTHTENDNSSQAGQVSIDVENEAQGKGQDQATCPVRPLFCWPPRYNLQELITRFSPFLIVESFLVCTVILAIDLTRPQLLFSSLPQKFQNIFSFSALLAFESACLALGFSIGYICYIMQLQFFEKCQHEFWRLSENLKHLTDLRGPMNQTGGGASIRNFEAKCEAIRRLLMEMQQLVALIELFNRVFPFCILAVKLGVMFFAVFGSFCAVRLTGSHPGVGVFAGYFSIAASLMYVIVYEKAFVIPDKMEELKEGALVSAHEILISGDSSPFRIPRVRIQSTLTWAEVRRKVGSFRNVGIRVGSFHVMERMSTPNFLYFVLDQVVSLLVLFPAGQNQYF